jgi:hypothetical protein
MKKQTGCKMKIKYVVISCFWRDKKNGNTYHSNRIINTKDGGTICSRFQYGNNGIARQKAIETMIGNNWIDKKYADRPYLYERENDYPILWVEKCTTQKECKSNVS